MPRVIYFKKPHYAHHTICTFISVTNFELKIAACVFVTMKGIVKTIVLFVLLINLFNPLYATDYPVTTYLGIDQGLSNNSVRCIYQDRRGFMWFGTYDGLNRYDGYSFKVFRNNFKNATSLINNWINTIDEDSDGNLWVGTRQGVCIYRP